MGVRSVKDLAGVVPNVTIAQQNGLAQVTIRGIGTNSTVVGADPSSAVYVDGVYLGRPAMVFADFLNIERVEVLRGPQGTLYGRNAVGGTINIVSRQPTNAFESSARITAGSYDEVRAEAVVSGPLVRNKVMGGVAFLGGSREGFVQDLDHPDHSLGSDDTWAGRGQLRLVFGPRSELLLSGDYGRFKWDSADERQAAEARLQLRQPGQSLDRPREHAGSRKEHPARRFGEARGPNRPDDDAD
jgi:iron complex outermembrane recepter protein